MEIGIAMIVAQFLVLVGVVASLVHSALSASREHKWAEEARIKAHAMAFETYKMILLLEKNTNSIKDALVKVTGEKAYAEGLKDGAVEGNHCK